MVDNTASLIRRLCPRLLVASPADARMERRMPTVEVLPFVPDSDASHGFARTALEHVRGDSEGSTSVSHLQRDSVRGPGLQLRQALD